MVVDDGLGCNFMNSKCISYLLRFHRLQSIDISHCTGLTAADIQMFRQIEPPALAHLKELNVAGVCTHTTHSLPPALSCV